MTTTTTTTTRLRLPKQRRLGGLNVAVLSPLSKHQKKSTIARYEQESELIRKNPKPAALIPEEKPQNELAPAPTRKTIQKKTVQSRRERQDSPLRQRHQELQDQPLQEPPMLPQRSQHVYRLRAATARDLQTQWFRAVNLPSDYERLSQGATHPRQDADNEGGRTLTDDDVRWGRTLGI
ncbi:hypothetical protein B0H13DRAFT_1888901 [Mycena leptocephala]|nr:hypothetical protein B0H13DRAFT_1888901 [Mycena leptocephala]